MPGPVTFYAADLLTGRVSTTLALGNVGFGVTINDTDSLAATVALSSGVGIKDCTTPGRTALTVDMGGVILWDGIIWGRKHTGASNSVALDAKTAFSYLDHITITDTLTYTQVDQITIAHALITYAAGKGDSDLGFVFVGDQTSGVLRDRTYLPGDNKTVGSALRELSAVEGGFDFITDARWNNGTVQRLFRTGYPKLGRDLLDSRLIVDARTDLDSWDYAEDAESSASVVYATGAVPEGSPDGTLPPTTVADYPTARTNGAPRLEAGIAFTDVTTLNVLTAHAQGELLLVRDNLITMNLALDPAGAGPGINEYTPGDELLLRIPPGDGFWPDSALIRAIITSVKIDLDTAQNATVTLGIAPTVILANPPPGWVVT